MKALNRKEALVNAKANGTLDSFKPLTRDEAFTKKALGLGGGASSWNDLKDKPFNKTPTTLSIYSNPNQSFDVYIPEDSNTGEPLPDFSSSSFNFGDANTVIDVDGIYTVVLDGVTYAGLSANVIEAGDAITAIYIGASKRYEFTDVLPFRIELYAMKSIPAEYPPEGNIHTTLCPKEYRTLKITCDSVDVYSNDRMEFTSEYAYGHCGYEEFPYKVFSKKDVYTVIWDGVKYSNLIAEDASYNNGDGESRIIGKIFAEDGSVTGVPFEITTYELLGKTYYTMFTTSTESSHSIEIIADTFIVDTIDDEYLPKASESESGTVTKRDVLRMSHEVIEIQSGKTTYSEMVDILEKIRKDQLSKTSILHMLNKNNLYYFTIQAHAPNFYNTDYGYGDFGAEIVLSFNVTDTDLPGSMDKYPYVLALLFNNLNNIEGDTYSEEYRSKLVLCGFRRCFPTAIRMSTDTLYNDNYFVQLNKDGTLKATKMKESYYKVDYTP